MNTTLRFCLFAFALTQASSAFAACSAKIIADVAAREDSSSVLSAGAAFGPPTQFLVEPTTGKSFVCAHGSYCYPSEAVQLKGCTIVPQGIDAGQQPGDDIYFSTE